MIKSLDSAASGMLIQQTTVDNIANNLANANTTAYKKSRMEFQDLLYVSKGNFTGKADPDQQVLSDMQIGSGAKSVANVKSFGQGTLEESNRELDVAIDGQGFFQILVNEETFFTRDGSFKIDAQRQLVTSAGHALEPAINVPENTENIIIGNDGTVSAKVAGQDQLQVLGEIELATFTNEPGLQSLGGNIYRETPASGEPEIARPGEEGNGVLRQNFLERSNVDTVSEMVKLIVAQRTYEINSKVIRTSDEMLSMTNNLIR
ncbi:flagellar basal-body rod protein FlgG [Candidatus Uabimicrobium amorphum]|uniref:Flagellar basal-body rod protein FlgG n=1 Tax=Uabimicrobium amorphum TaxID=2596890 RepID=A0A5S9INX6_UABAM|nr:flagellar basal-body rod protein FlgG [Candidatus Uabimicrobium amorphum]BBM84987.1 flagellar basal-body rod protein FlgG [Candidatus Uabimicrobium amorphum]